MNSRGNFALRLLFIAGLLAIWELLVRALDVPVFLLPAPSAVFMALYRGTSSGLYIEHVGVTLAETLMGFALGSAAALVLGTLVALSRRFDYFMYPLIVMFQAMPKVALAPLIIIWFGLGIQSKVVNAALVCFFPLMINTIVGLRSAEEDRVSLMRSLAASPMQVFWMLRLPNAMPYIFAGLEIAMIFALIGAIVGEFVGAQSGLGMLIQSMNFTMDVAGQFSVLLILSVIGLSLNAFVSALRRRVIFWDAAGKTQSAARAVTPRTAPAERTIGMQRMRSKLGCLAFGALASLAAAPAARAETTIKVGWCARTLSAAASPFAIARKMGWFGDLKVEPVPLPGSTDCVKEVATRDMPYALPSIEPLAIIRPQGVKAKVFYTAYQGNVYGIAVPADSPIHGFADLKGKTVGVTSMASAGVVIARAVAASAGINPDSQMRIVVAGEGAQTAALVNTHQVDALSQFDTQYVLAENAGAKLRMLDNAEIARFPSNGFIALEETLANRRSEAAALARGYAMGQVFAIANPEAAIRIMYEVFPATKPTGKDEATAIADDVRTLNARARNWRLEAGGVTRWGESSPQNYQAYLDFLVKWGVVKQPVSAAELVTNDLLPDIDTFDPEKIAADAKAWTGK